METTVRSDQGFTLIELVLVIVLIAIIGTLTITRISSIAQWQHESDLRRFSVLWESLSREASNRGEAYRLLINIDSNSYSVRRESPIEPGGFQEVDYLSNLRTKGEQERRRQKAEEEALGSLEEEFQREDIRQSGSLVSLFYSAVFQDPNTNVRLTAPLEAPSLAEEKIFSQGLFIRDIEIGTELLTEGSSYIRLAPRLPSTPLIVHFQTGEDVYSMYAEPVHGRIITEAGDVRFRDVFDRQEKDRDELNPTTQR